MLGGTTNSSVSQILVGRLRLTLLYKDTSVCVGGGVRGQIETQLKTAEGVDG